MRRYQDNDPKGWCGDPKRGAAMGRYDIHEANPNDVVKLHLVRIRLDQGGYDVNGTYFGTGTPLYWYATDDGKIDAVLRAENRVAAKNKISEKYKNAKFYR